MFTLQEIFDNLTYGNLSHVSIGNAALGYIEAKDYPKIVNGINNALTAIHKRFLLRKEEIQLQQQSGVSTYYIRSDFAASNTANPSVTKYLIDSAEKPFQDNLFKIESVTHADGTDWPLNDSSQEYPLFTPSFDVLVMPPSDPLEVVKIGYRANHPRIAIPDTGFDPKLIQLHIPASMLDALSLNIASRIYTPLTAGDGQNSAASTFMYQYEQECLRLEMENMALQDDVSDTRFESNGFV